MKNIIEKLRIRHTYLSLTSEEANMIADALEAKDSRIVQLETELLMLKSK